MSKRFIRPKPTAEDCYGLSLAAFYNGLATGTIPLKQIPILDRAVGFDEDEIILH
jgi:predicted DNA-binding transcriptional regulator AlpA